VRWFALVVVLAGCDRFLKLDEVTAPDARPDAPPVIVCKKQIPAPFFCADFDDPSAPAYIDGVVLPLPTPVPAGITAMPQPPGFSPDNALWVDTGADTPNNDYTFELSSPRLAPTMHTELDLNVDHYDTAYSTEIVELGLVPVGAPTPPCHAQLQLDSTGLRLRPRYCPNTAQPVVVFPVVPTQQWIHLSFDVDITLGQATATYGLNTATVQLGTNAVGGNPYIAVGVFHVQNGSGPKVGFDDIVATLP
jgi:hypothetical protein